VNISWKLGGVEDKVIVGAIFFILVSRRLILVQVLAQEGWLEIFCKNTSPTQFIMRLFQPCVLFRVFVYSHYAYLKEEPYEMQISRTVLERRFVESNDDRNGC